MDLIDRFAYLFLGLLCGWLLCLYLQQRRPPQLAAVQPKPGSTIPLWDSVEREGMEPKATGTHGR